MPMDPWKVNIDALKPTGGVFGVYRSNLSAHMANVVTNAELTITLRIELSPVRTLNEMVSKLPPGLQPWVKMVVSTDRSFYPDAGKKRIEITEWKQADWLTWLTKYQKEGQKYWNGRFWLKTPATWTKFDFSHGKKTIRPNVYCRFVLEASDKPFREGHHKKITVVKLKKKEFFQSHDSLYDNQDIYLRPTEGARKQLPLVHEVGHALGMLHVRNLVDPSLCGGADLNDDMCYGTTEFEKDNIMGKGMKITAANANPWLERIAEHTGTKKDDWKVSTHRIYPRVV
jgi:hypothetical protein